MSGFRSTRLALDTVIETIARTIADRLRPRRVILIGSRARGDAWPNSDYDVVVEFDGDSKSAWERSSEIYGLFPDRNWSLDVIARAIGEIERNANDPGTLDWDIVREGKVLYAAPGVSTITRPSSSAPPRVREELQEPPPSVRDWVAQAERDLEQARRCLSQGDAWNYACYFAQQAAEKHLKALLVSRFVRPPHTHKLGDLLTRLKSIGGALPGVDADCAVLPANAVETRYRAPSSFDEATGRAAVAAARRIAGAAQRAM